MPATGSLCDVARDDQENGSPPDTRSARVVEICDGADDAKKWNRVSIAATVVGGIAAGSFLYLGYIAPKKPTGEAQARQSRRWVVAPELYPEGGAGLGALMGGKKGALAGAAIGGGAAAIYDQVKRH